MKSQVPSLTTLHPQQLKEVIADLMLQKDGAKLYLAVDAHEVFDFCFPFNPANPRELQIETISDDQAALYEVFFVRRERPILLPEYAGELQGLLAFFNHEVDQVYSGTEILEELIRAGRLQELTYPQEDVLELILQSDFSFRVLLAVIMGIYSLGVDRFQSVFRERRLSTTIEAESTSDGHVISEIQADYKRTTLVHLICDELERIHNESKVADLEKARLHRADLTDASAIDRIIYLNSAFERAYLTKRLSRRYVVLYLSSAHRTQRIFSLPRVRNALPEVNGAEFPFWRTRRQLFTYVVYKSKSADATQHYTETIGNMNSLTRVIREVRRLEEAFTADTGCNQCPLVDGNSVDCEFLGFCNDVKALRENIETARGQIEDLGLVSAIDSYSKLLAAKPNTASHATYVQFFNSVFSSGIKDIAMNRMRQKQEWMLLMSESAYLFKVGVNSVREFGPSAFRSSRDLITDITQNLPSKPNVRTPRYSEIIDLILSYFRDPSQVAALRDAYSKYVNLDLDPERGDAEQELLRCYLYLAFQSEGGEERAYKYAQDLLNTRALFEANPPIEREYRYLLCWVARRLGRFVEADECLGIAISKWPADARFHHGRCLNIYSWLNCDSTSYLCPYRISDAIVAANTAIELYIEDSAGNRDVIAANWANLCHLYAWQTTEEIYSMTGAATILNLSRKALDTLKELVNKSEWNPYHPEYFYLEAYLEYQEFLVQFSSGNAKAVLKSKLENAVQNIRIAVQLYEDGPNYQRLKQLIERAWEKTNTE